MSKTDIWMPLYIGDYLADTMRLTTEQHGAYLLLLMECWRCGSVADDDEELSAVTRLPIESWLKQRPKLSRFFLIEGGQWRQSRLEKERIAAQKRRASAQENGLKGGRPKTPSKSKNNPDNNPKITHGLAKQNPMESYGLAKHKAKPNPQKSSSPSPSPKESLPGKNQSLSRELSSGGDGCEMEPTGAEILNWGTAE